MTQPPVNPWDAISATDEAAAMGSITKMLTGTKVLQNEPGVVYALAQQNAHPADAQAVDQFMQGLNAEKQVRLAQATGHKIAISDDMKSVLNASGVDYSSVEYTHQDALNTIADRISTESGGKLRAKVDGNGKYVVDAQGNVQTESTEGPSHKYKAKGIGRLFQTLHNDVLKPLDRDVLSPTLNVVTKGYNEVSSGIGDELRGFFASGSDMASGQAQHIAGAGNASVGGESAQAGASRIADMNAQGYDPNNVFSVLAFAASGHAHADLTGIERHWDDSSPSGLFGWTGAQAVGEAARFLDDPAAYRKAIEQDASNYEVVGTNTVLTKAGQEKIAALSSPQFADLTRRVAAQTSTIGNDLANAIGIDPVKHDTAYALTAAGTNIATSFVIDPTNLGLNAAKTIKIAKIGIDSLGDFRGAEAVLSGKNAATRGWQQAIDKAREIKAASAAGDDVRVAKLTAEFNPDLAPILDEFLGTKMLRNPDEWAGVDKTEPTFTTGDGITSMQDAINFVGSRYGLIRLMNGRAATQSSLMPGAMSAFGVKKLKSALAGWMTERSALRAEKNYNKVISAAEADPGGLGQRLVDSGDLERTGAQADDAITFHNENVIADKPFLNTRDEIRSTVAKLSERSAPIKADIASLHSELDDLEARLQELHGSKNAHPDQIAQLHDQIQTGRDLIAQQEHALTSGSLKHQTALEDQNAALAQGENTASKGTQFGNAPIGKDVSTDTKSFNEHLSPDVSYTLTFAGKGNVARNLRKSGDPLGDAGAFGWVSPTAIAARTRLAAQRFTTMLPRNTMIDIDDAASGDKLYKMALTYLNRGDANALKAAWYLGDGAQRKAIVSGIIDQIGHAAGLGHTESGQAILDSAKTAVEDYSSVGDNVVIDGQTLALHAGQVRTKWVLPTFQAIQQASKNLGWWEATMGRALTSNTADVLMSQWKLGALMKPNTVTRNQLEGWLRTALEGQFGEAIKAKAFLTAPNKELWAKGFEKASKAEHDALLAAGDTKGAREIANGSRLSGETLGRSSVTKHIAEFAPIALAGRAYRGLTGKTMDTATLEAMLTLGKDELQTAMEEYGQQIREADLGTRRAAREATEITDAGYGPARVKYALNNAARKGDKAETKSSKWTLQDTLGDKGADRYEHALAMRVNATPEVARAVMDHLEHPEEFDIQHVMAAHDLPEYQQKMRLIGYGKVTWDDPNGTARLATSDAERLSGKEEWANKVVNDYRHLLTGQNHQYQQLLADEIRKTGQAPSSDWIMTHLKNDARPEGVLDQELMPMANGGVRGAIQALQDVQGGAYQFMVERPLQRTTSSPVFLANYAEARVGLNDMVDELVTKHGIAREAAENMAKELSIKNAWVKTEQLIDDPGQKTQFDVMARNMFPFSRATQAMIRRWGGGMWQDPSKARKMMLAYEGGVQSGFIYDNAYGEPTFTYPGSGVLNGVMREIAKIPGFENVAQFPISSDMTGGVLMAVPGADNPFRMSMGPMISIPMREIFNQFPNHKAILDQVDAFINGPIGVGETWSQAVPTLVRRFYTNLTEGDQDTAFASAVQGAYANLAAAGMIPKPDASPSELASFRKHVEAQVHNQLIARAVFGLLAPAAMSTPSEGTDASHADYAFHISGIQQLSEEYKTILNETGSVPRANAVWAALHPDEFITKNNIPVPTAIFSGYTVSKSQATASKVALPATAESLNWMESHRDFLDTYATVGAYFLPMQSFDDPFSEQAYKTQKELGLRQAKTPQQFYEDIEIRNAESTFYPAVDGFHKRIDEAKAIGNTTGASAWTKAMSKWESDFKLANPLFAAKLDQYGPARATAAGQMSDLKKMLKDGHVPDGQGALLGQLVANYQGMVDFQQKHKGADNQSTAVRSGALAIFNDWVAKNIQGTSLADLYSGVFRVLNTNLVNVSSYGS